MILLTAYNVSYFDITTEVFMSPGCDIQSTVKKYSLFDNKVEIQKMNKSHASSTRLTMASNFCTFYRCMNLFSVSYIVFITYYVLMALLHNELEEETSFALQKRYLNILP